MDGLSETYRAVGPPDPDLHPAGAFKELCGSRPGYHTLDESPAEYQADLLSVPPDGIEFCDGASVFQGDDLQCWQQWRDHLLRDKPEADDLRRSLGIRQPYCEPFVRDQQSYAVVVADSLA